MATGMRHVKWAYASPVDVVGSYLLGLRQAKDALLEAEFRVGRAHWNTCHGLVGAIWEDRSKAALSEG